MIEHRTKCALEGKTLGRNWRAVCTISDSGVSVYATDSNGPGLARNELDAIMAEIKVERSEWLAKDPIYGPGPSLEEQLANHPIADGQILGGHEHGGPSDEDCES